MEKRVILTFTCKRAFLLCADFSGQRVRRLSIGIRTARRAMFDGMSGRKRRAHEMPFRQGGCLSLTGNFPAYGDKFSKEVPTHARKSYAALQRVQTKKLQHDEKQEEYPGQDHAQQVLSLLPQTYGSFGNEVTRDNDTADQEGM